MGTLKEQTKESFDQIADLPDKWDHNRFYHPRIMRMLPLSGGKALDAGCGTGELTRLLADRFTEVIGVDMSPRMIEEASKRNPHPRIKYLLGDIEEMKLEDNSFDAIVSIAAMHHTDMDVLLPRFRDALKNNGVLVVLDLYLQKSPVELTLNALATPLNLVSNLVVHRGRKPVKWKILWKRHWEIDRHVAMTGSQIQEIVGKHLPGAGLKRHLFWRYSLVFVKGEDLQEGAPLNK